MESFLALVRVCAYLGGHEIQCIDTEVRYRDQAVCERYVETSKDRMIKFLQKTNPGYHVNYDYAKCRFEMLKRKKNSQDI